MRKPVGKSFLAALTVAFAAIGASAEDYWRRSVAAGASLVLTILEPQPGARFASELSLSIELAAYGLDGIPCKDCFVIDTMAAEVCVDGGLGEDCRRLEDSAQRPMSNVKVRGPGRTAYFSEVVVWVRTPIGDGSTTANISAARTYLWESAEAAAVGLRKRALTLAAETAQGRSTAALQTIVEARVSAQLSLAFALSQAGRWRAARAELDRTWRETGSQSARRWLRALDSGIALRKTLDLDYVEVGCSSHRTITQSLVAGSAARGLAVEPVGRYLSEMMSSSAANRQLGEWGGRGLPAVVGVRAALDEGLDEERQELMYFMAVEDVSQHIISGSEYDESRFLLLDHLGCNSLGAPHPSLERAFSERGLSVPWSTEPVDVLSFRGLMERYGSIPGGERIEALRQEDENFPLFVHRVGLLKVDVEGKDLAVLRSVLDHCDSASLGAGRGIFCPLAIQFEALDGYEGEEARAALLVLLTGTRSDGGVGLYHIPTRDDRDFGSFAEHDVYLSLVSSPDGIGADSKRPPSVFAWSGPLGLIVDGTETCGGDDADGDTQGDVVKLIIPQSAHAFAAGVPALARLVYQGYLM
jgi:hypothetical protein